MLAALIYSFVKFLFEELCYEVVLCCGIQNI
jgi:hypothetical protein